ncbi:thiol-disulfide oxidoreductase DCC family protein [uncultured Photobacterium sp.]|uniref:thiol-disulfide oxidoreductase DCC family protein n=1 Tax=uncultured Photobacterium sp. TaxID=173973 RepID=UPI00261551DD|nr:DCC1-like thiol-disulfide oxidoreductase family protein [uncultured Photobacterium sp.]
MDRLNLTVFYDGSCESCVKDRAYFEHWLGKSVNQVQWFDITDQDAELQRLGIDPALALKELHVQGEDGVIYRELDAYILLLKLVWWLRPVVWVIQIPLVRVRISRWYRRMVDQRLAREGRG